MKTWQFILILILLCALGVFLLLIFLGYVLQIPVKQTPIDITNEQKKLSTPPIDPSRDTIVGNPAGRVTIVAYMDFGCTHCKTVWGHLNALMQTSRGAIRLVWKDIPRFAQQGSIDAHVAARCAYEQNKFREYVDALYALQPNFSNTRLRSLAITLGLNLPRFTACQERKDHPTRLDVIRTEADALSLTGTPTLFINNERLEGEVSHETLQSIIESEKKKSSSLPLR